MMSVTTVSTGAASSGYYKTEGYYAAGTEQGDAAASWFGKGAEDLGLSDRVDDQLFTQMLEGQTYEKGEGGIVAGRVMGRSIEGRREHRPGLDLTFSAPKSVSIAALVYGDEKLVEVHDKAVRTAMEHVEKNLVQTRDRNNGEIRVETGGRIIAGLFRHDTSRALDPQLHTHAVIANMVKNSNGDYRALHNDKIFRNQKLTDEIYKAELAKGAAELGYTVLRVGPERQVEIKEVSSKLVDQFSKRREEIQAALSERGMEASAKNAELAALATRATKSGSVDRLLLRQNWIGQAKDLGIEVTSPQELIRTERGTSAPRLPGVTREGGISPVTSQDARESVAKAVAHISESAVTYSREELTQTALRFSRKSGIDGVEGAIDRALRKGELLSVKDRHSPENALSDPVSLRMEQELSRLFRAGSRGKALDLKGYASDQSSPANALSKRLNGSTLSEGQKAAVLTALTGSGQTVGVQGFAGTGKTFMLEKLVTEAAKAGYKVEGLAPSRQAVAQLKDAVPTAETIQARLLRGGGKIEDRDPTKTILAVDEASMVSTNQMLGLLQQAREQKIARVVLIGDVQQLDAVAAGTPFALLQKIGMRTAVMDDIQRQRNSDAKDVVNSAIAGDVKKAFSKLDSGVHTTEDVAKTAAQLFVEAQENDGSSTGLVTPSNRTRTALNGEIRSLLKADGKLPTEDVVIDGLNPLRFSRVEISDPLSFRKGDVILAHQAVSGQNLKKGHSYIVTEVDEKTGLTIQDRATGETSPLQLGQNTKASGSIEVFEETRRPFAEGDQVKFRITDPTSDIENGETGRVVGISDTEINVELKDGRAETIAKNSLAAAGLDHAYALTGHDFQGATVDRIIVAMTANEKLADQKGFYVAVSRARDEISLVTDNPAELAERLERQTGEKVTALEAYLDAAKEKTAAAKEEEKSKEDIAEKEIERVVDPERDEKERHSDLLSAIQQQKGDIER